MASTSRLFIALIMLLLSSPTFAQFDFAMPADDGWQAREEAHGFSSLAVVRPTLEAPSSTIAGARLPVIIDLEFKPGWHIWTNDRELPAPMEIWDGATLTTITVTSTSDDVRPFATHIRWPEPHPYDTDVGDGTKTYGVFEERATIYLPVIVDEDASPGSVTLEVAVDFQACDANGCKAPATWTGRVDIEVHPAPVATGETSSDALAAFPMEIFDSIDPDSTRAADGGTTSRGTQGAPERGGIFGLVATVQSKLQSTYIGLLVLAMIGGFLLNFTPCVLPVIPLKIMGLVQSAHGSRVKTLMLGAAMAGGVIAFWMVLGLFVATINNFSTNQLFQFPVFTIGVGSIVAVLAIGMIGAFTVGLPQSVYKFNPTHDTLQGSFLFGIMAAILSTPCTAPFMGGAITASVGQPKAIVLTVFFALGLGMSLPYLVLAANPKWIEKLPRTGPASELLKQVLGIVMLAVAAYFIGIGVSGIMQQPGMPASKAYWYAVGALSAIAGVWLLIRSFMLTKRSLFRRVAPTLVVCFVVLPFVSTFIGAGYYFSDRMTQKGPITWVYYTPERLNEYLSSNHAVMLKFTAEWCANCHALEHAVVNKPEIVDGLSSRGVIPMKVDITGNNASGNELLNRYSKSIPYLVIQRPDGTVAFESDWYTVDDVLEGIDAATNGTSVAMK